MRKTAAYFVGICRCFLVNIRDIWRSLLSGVVVLQLDVVDILV